MGSITLKVSKYLSSTCGREDLLVHYAIVSLSPLTHTHHLKSTSSFQVYLCWFCQQVQVGSRCSVMAESSTAIPSVSMVTGGVVKVRACLQLSDSLRRSKCTTLDISGWGYPCKFAIMLIFNMDLSPPPQSIAAFVIWLAHCHWHIMACSTSCSGRGQWWPCPFVDGGDLVTSYSAIVSNDNFYYHTVQVSCYMINDYMIKGVGN